MSIPSLDIQSSVADALREAIEERIPGATVFVAGGSGHFRIEVGSRVFVGRGLLESQRIVYGAIAHLMSGENPPVHAIDSLSTHVPTGV